MENFKPENKAENELSLEEKLEKSEAENKDLKEKLDNREKLLKIIAHDLRSPIGNNTVFIDHLNESIKNKTMTEHELPVYLEMLSTQSRNTYKLLVDLFEWVKIQQGGIKPELLPTDLYAEVENSIASLKEIAKRKEVDLENKISSENVKILADSNMLNTIVRNLTSNAIKYTEKGGNIIISSKNNNDNVEIHISDDGVGLSDDAKQNIFDVLNPSKEGTEGEKGTRFGLSICKEFVEKMNGTIRVESEGEGKGTTFIITLPAGEKSK